MGVPLGGGLALRQPRLQHSDLYAIGGTICSREGYAAVTVSGMQPPEPEQGIKTNSVDSVFR